MMHEITIRISLTPGRIRVALLLLLLTAFPRLSATQDEPQLWSYFPPPTASLRTLSAGEADPMNLSPAPLELARDFGNVQIGNFSFPNSNLTVVVGEPPGSALVIGRPPRLRVRGTLRVNGCIYLKNGVMGAPAPTWTGSSWTPGTFEPGSYWRCIYNP